MLRSCVRRRTWRENTARFERACDLPVDVLVTFTSTETGLSAVTLSATTWWRTWKQQDGDRLIYLNVVTFYWGRWISLHEQSTTVIASCGWRYSDSGWKKSTILRVHYAGQSIFYTTSRPSWFEVVRHWSLPSAIRRLYNRRNSGLYSSPAPSRFSLSLVVTDRCGMLFKSITGRYIHYTTYPVVFLCCDCWLWLFSDFLFSFLP